MLILDTFKGSYYNNPQYDVPTEDSDMIERYPEVCSKNIWPKEDLPELEPAFKDLGELITQVGTHLVRHCDNYAKSILQEDYSENTLTKCIEESRTCKARLLYYFPLNDDSERAIDSWCGWHNDHSLITGLCPALYRDLKDDKVDCANPDINAGLHVKTRDGTIMKAGFKKNQLGFQIGLTAQVLTGGAIQATPHAVRALKYPESEHISRTTMAVFMQPNFDVVLNEPGKIVKDGKVDHFEKGMNFGDFGAATIKEFYAEGNY